MSYNLKCCSFYPNNFDASALTPTEVHMHTDRSTHVHRPKYTRTPTEVHTAPTETRRQQAHLRELHYLFS